MRVMHDLRETIDRLLEAGVVSVDENERLASGRARYPRVEIGARLSQVHPIGAKRDEVALRIAGRRRWPLHIARRSRAIGRDRNDDVGEIKPSTPGSAKHDARRLRHRGSRCRHRHVDLTGAGRGRADNEIAVGTAGAARSECGKSDDKKTAGARQARRLLHAQTIPKAPAQPRPRDANAPNRARLRLGRQAPLATRTRPSPANPACLVSPAPPASGPGS